MEAQEANLEIKLLDDGNIEFQVSTSQHHLISNLTPSQAANLAAQLLTSVRASFYHNNESPPILADGP